MASMNPIIVLGGGVLFYIWPGKFDTRGAHIHQQSPFAKCPSSQSLNNPSPSFTHTPCILFLHAPLMSLHDSEQVPSWMEVHHQVETLLILREGGGGSKEDTIPSFWQPG